MTMGEKTPKLKKVAKTGFIGLAQWHPLGKCKTESSVLCFTIHFPDLCNTSAANITSEIVSYLDCGEVSDKITFRDASVLRLANGTFCSISNDGAAVMDDEEVDTGHILRCDISEGHPFFKTCFSSSGTHSKTFWLYLVATSVYQWAHRSMFSLFDGTSLRYR